MLDQLERELVDPSSPKKASLRRVAAAGIVAVLAPLVVGAVLLRAGLSFRTEGLGAFIGVALLYALFAATVVRLLRVRTVLIGLMTTVSPAMGALMFSRSLAGFPIMLGIGVLGGFLGTRSRALHEVTARGYLALTAVLAGAALIQVFGVHNTVEQAAMQASGGDGEVLATYEFDGAGEAYALVDSPWGNVDGYVVVHLRRDSLHNWQEETSEVVADTKFQGRRHQDTLAGGGGFFGSSEDVPDLCAHPRVWRVTQPDLQGGCWLPHRRIIVGVAPRAATTIALTHRDGSVRVRDLHPVGGGYVIPSTAYDGSPLTEAHDVVRVAFFDESGRLIDSRPSARVAYDWFPELARIGGAAPCRSYPGGSYGCPDKTIPSSSAVYHASMSISILAPEEYRVVCNMEPPPGDWVVLGSVAGVDDLLPVEGRLIKSEGATQVITGAKLAGDDLVLRPETARVSPSDLPCFPGASSAHEIDIFLRYRTGTDGFGPVLSPSPRPYGWTP